MQRCRSVVAGNRKPAGSLRLQTNHRAIASPYPASSTEHRAEMIQICIVKRSHAILTRFPFDPVSRRTMATIRSSLPHEDRTASEPRENSLEPVVLSNIREINDSIRLLRLSTIDPNCTIKVCCFAALIVHSSNALMDSQ